MTHTDGEAARVLAAREHALTELARLEAPAVNRVCPKCGSDHVRPPRGYRLALCLSCSVMFDTMGDAQREKAATPND